MNRFNKVLVLMIMVVILVIVGVIITKIGGKNKDEIESSKPIIAVSIVPEETFVKAVCGDLVDIVTMIPPGYSPENYEPTPKEIQKFNDAKIYFSIGVPTEENNILPNVSQNTKVIKLEENVRNIYPDIEMPSGGRDPHIWLSPKRAIIMVKDIANEMSILDSINKEIYEKNAKEYIEKLEKLDLNISSSFESINDKKIIVYHPAFGYLANDYGIQMYSLEEDGKEATPEHLQEMIDLAKKENIKIIFYQEEIDSSQSQSFAEEIGGRTVMLSPLASNYIENFEQISNIIKEVIKDEGSN